MDNFYDPDWAITTRFEGPLTSVTVENLVFGIKGTGHALCNEDDVFDEDFGTTLAATRAYARAYNKLAKLLANSIRV